MSADLDRAARSLYEPLGAAVRCARCGRELSLAECLKHECSACGALTVQGLAPDVTPERARKMLAALRARRAELGLEP